MKKNLAFLITGSVVALTACTHKMDTSDVPSPVRESFAKQFPGAAVKWEKEDEKYEAGFKQDGLEMSAVYEANGTLTESEVEIPETDLPEAAKNYIKTHYNNAAIKEAAKITTANGSIEYEAAIKGKDIIFDAAGNFLREDKE